MSSNYNVGYVAERVASKIGLQWPIDKELVFENLSLVQENIWMSGKFHDSMKFFYCSVYPDGTIRTPHGYNTLVAIDLNGKPVQLNDQSFLFHSNGLGDVLSQINHDKRYYTGVMDMGEEPVLFQPTDENTCNCRRIDCNPKYIMVRSLDCNYDLDPPFTEIAGLGVDGQPIYSYEEEDAETGETSCCICNAEEARRMENVVNGVRYPILNKAKIYNTTKFSKITNILKTPTRTPVEYWYVDDCKNAALAARMEPYQIRSVYKKYKVPDKCCKWTCVLGLFKRSKPDPIISENQIFISSNIDAIISLAISMKMKYDDRNILAASAFAGSAAASLNAELRESSGQNWKPIQVKTHGKTFRDFPRL